jgi:LysR family transcriptional regulator, low CO2-responsive transcriptional regulator
MNLLPGSGGELIMTSDQQTLVEIESSSECSAGFCVESLHGARPVELWAGKRVKMTLNQFSLFAAVARHHNLTKASEELRISQPSISLQLKQLEDHHGAKLYRRVSKGIEITEAGHLFLRKITPILEQVAELERGFTSSAPQVIHKALAVGGTFSASAVLLPQLLARFQERHPNAELEFQTSSSEQLERLVAKAAMDLAVIDRKPGSNDLIFEALRREKVVLFVPADHRLAGQKTPTVSDVLAEPLIIRGGKGISGTTENALKKLRDQGWMVRVGMRCEGPVAITAAVRQNMGVGIAFEDSVRAEIDSGEFKVLDVPGFEIEAESFIVYPKHRALSPLAQEFFELLRGARVQAEKLDQASRHAIPINLRDDKIFATPPVVPS